MLKAVMRKDFIFSNTTAGLPLKQPHEVGFLFLRIDKQIYTLYNLDMIDRFNKFEMEKVTKYIDKCRKYIPKDKLDEWDILVLKAKWKNMKTGKGLCKIVNIVDVITAIEKGKKQGKDMKESLKWAKQPFKYYLLVAKFSKFGDEYLKYYVEKYGKQEDIENE